MPKFSSTAAGFEGLDRIQRLEKHAADSPSLTPGSSTDNVIQQQTVGSVPLVVKAAAGATADLLQFQDSTGAVLQSFNASGSFSGGSQIYVGPPSGVTTGATDRATINAALAVAKAAGGGAVILNAGTYYTDQQIKIPANCRLVGAGKRATILKAASGFAINTPIVRLGEGTGIVFDCQLRSLTVDANNVTGSTCIYSTEVQEGSGCFSVLPYNYTAWGIDFESGTSLIAIEDCEPTGSTAGSTGGILLTATAGVNTISKVTVASTAGVHGTGISVVSAHALLSQIHVERHTDGISGGLNSSGFIAGAVGHSTTTNLVHLLGTTRDWAAADIVANSATNTIVDDYNGKTWTDSIVRLYSQYEAIIGAARIKARVVVLTYSATVATDATLGDRFRIPVSNTTAFTISNPTNPFSDQSITYDIANNSGGVMGAITWGANMKLAGAFVNPANAFRRTISFYYDGTNWIETGRAAADI